MNKTNKHNITNKTKTKKESQLKSKKLDGEYSWNMRTMERQWTKPETKREIATGLVKYVLEHEDCWNLYTYFALIGKRLFTYRRWMKNEVDEELRDHLVECYEYTKMVLGQRLLEHGLKNDLSTHTQGAFILPQLLDLYKEEDERRAAQKTEQSKAGVELIKELYGQDTKEVPDTGIPYCPKK